MSPIRPSVKAREYADGWSAFERGAPLDATQPPEWQRGWRNAERDARLERFGEDDPASIEYTEPGEADY